MAKPSNIFDKIHDGLIRHAVAVLRFAENVREKITVNLYRLANDLVNKIRDTNPSTKAGAAFVTKKLEALIKSARKAIANAYADNADLLNSSLRDLARLENQYYPKLINGIVGADVAKIPMSITETKALADDSVILGGPAAEWWDKQDRKLQDQFASQMRLGYGAGEGIEELVERVRGGPTGRTRKLTAPDGQSVEILEYSGGIMDASRRDATALVRTAIQNLSNNVLNSTYDANDDIIKGKQWISTLDPVTCVRCFDGSMRVQVLGDLRKVFRSLYKGEMLIIRTAAGKEMRVTPNHPILTSRGWLPANKLEPCKDILYSVDSGGFCSHCAKNIGVPPTFAELADAVFKPSVSQIFVKGAAAADFHGDGEGRDHNIDIARLNSHLRPDSVSSFVKDLCQPAFCRLNRCFWAIFARLGNFAKSLWGGAFSTAKFYSAFFKNIEQYAFAVPGLFGDAGNRPSRFVQRDKKSNDILRKLVNFSPFEDWHYSKLFEVVSNSSNGSVVLPCQRCGRRSVTVRSDNVVEIGRYLADECHVYNLESDQGCYTIDGLIVKNCRALDKCSWGMDGEPLDERSKQFPFQTPPAHMNCRCVIVGLTYSWEELIKRNGGTVPKGLTEVDTTTRASMNGQVSAAMNYDDWLQTQSISTQKEVLGDKRWDLWRTGKVTLGDLVDQSGRALTLDELYSL